tara:strand:- start:18474 stop:19370 length:897 start_codon:yes stop_codon:yes gene_type:complete
MVKKGKVKKMESGLERRRTVRIRRSSLIKNKLEGIDRPAMKIAETQEELEQAFGIVYDAYRAANYIKEPHPSKMAYGIHSLLPTTCVFVFKSYLSVLSTMTYIPDTPVFGLPMDAVYKEELDTLRNQGRNIAEVGALATPKQRRWINLISYLAKALFWYARMTDVDDVCIMVNPKHVRFYKEIFLFEDFGEEKWYEGVDAPAVALRVDMDNYERKMTDAYGEADFDTDLLSFFTKVNNVILDPNIEYPIKRTLPLDMSTVKGFITKRPELLETMTEDQEQLFRMIYYEINGIESGFTH